MTRRAILVSNLIGMLGAMLLCSCSPAENRRSSQEPEGSDSSGDADADSDSDSDGDTASDTVCDAVDFAIEVIPPRMMFLVDVSSSMDCAVDETSSGSCGDVPIAYQKMTIAHDALEQMIKDYADRIWFGVDRFPGAEGCSPWTAPAMDIIMEFSLAATFSVPRVPTGSSTPMYCGMGNFLDDGYAPNFTSKEAETAARYLVIVSDGADLCGEGCCTGPLNPKCRATTEEFVALTQKIVAKGIRIFTIGFGAIFDEDVLSQIAANGNTPYTQFFSAEDGAKLSAALNDIGKVSVSCEYEFPNIKDDADAQLVNVYFKSKDDPGADPKLIGQDLDCQKGKGWDWSTKDDFTKIRFCQSSCEELGKGKVDVQALFGCITVPVV